MNAAGPKPARIPNASPKSGPRHEPTQRQRSARVEWQNRYSEFTSESPTDRFVKRCTKPQHPDSPLKNRRGSENERFWARSRRRTGSKPVDFVEDSATPSWRERSVCSPCPVFQRAVSVDRGADGHRLSRLGRAYLLPPPAPPRHIAAARRAGAPPLHQRLATITRPSHMP